MMERDLQRNSIQESHRDLPAWQSAMDVAAEVCHLAAQRGGEGEGAAVVRDLRLAVSAIAAHIAAAHGCGVPEAIEAHQQRAQAALDELVALLHRAQGQGWLQPTAALQHSLATLSRQLTPSLACCSAA